MFLLAAEYEYPVVVPDCLPKRPFRLGPEKFQKPKQIKTLNTIINQKKKFTQSEKQLII
jgi:hypothetical protein